MSKVRFFSICSITISALTLGGCSTPQTYSQLQQRSGVELRAELAGVMLYERRTADLPNAFGNADVFGRKVEKGYRSMVYQGLRPDGVVVLRVITVDVSSNETTMNRTPMAMTTGSTYRVGNQTYGSAVTTYSAPGRTESLPPNVAEIAVNPPFPASLEWAGHSIEVRSATPTAITYVIR